MGKLCRRHLLWFMGILFGVFLGHSDVQGQGNPTYFNEWYRSNQNYIKLRLFEDGPFRVYLSDLSNAGVTNLSSLDPDNIQVIYRGKEISILVKKTVTGDLDYFEFEGRRNDGGIDSLMYRNPYSPYNFDPSQQPSIYTSFFTDTSAYFVTWDSVGTKRRTEFQTAQYAAYTPASTYRFRQLSEYRTAYYSGGGGRSDANHVINPDYITGEGYVSTEIETGDSPELIAKVVSCAGYVPGVSPPTRMRVRALGVNASDSHVLNVSILGQEVFQDTTTGITITTREFDVNGALINGNIVVRFQAKGTGVRPDKQRVAWFTIDYNRSFDLNLSNRSVIRDWDSQDTAYFRFTRADVISEAWIWDPVNNLHIRADVSGDTLHFLVPPASQRRDLILYTDKALKSPIVLPTTALANIGDTGGGAEFLIISDQKFSNSANQYALYRDTTSVNRLSSKVVYVDQIMDEFGYGSYTPMAVKNFVQFALEHWTVRPKYVMLWGKGQYNPRQSKVVNYVPAFGYPASDYEFVSNFDRDTVDLVPQAGIGRLCITKDSEGLDYLAKVSLYEHMPYASWMKESVFLGGGQTSSEQASIKDALLIRFIPLLLGPPLMGHASWFQKTGNGIETNSQVPSHTLIDRGVGILQFFGHSSTNIFDVDILEASRYNNFGKFPFMVAFGCHGGDFVQASQSFGERFVLEANRGSIGYLANSTEGFLGQLRDYGRILYQSMMGSQYGKPVGDVIKETIRLYAHSNSAQSNILAANHCKQLNLQGDPSIVLRFPQKPDLSISESMVWFEPEQLIAENTSFILNMAVKNEGMSFQDSFVVRITQRLPSGIVIQHPDTLMSPVGYLDTISLVFPNNSGQDMAGLNTFTIQVDAPDSLAEYREDNNAVVLEVLVQGSTPALIYPYEYAIVGKDTLSLVAGSYVLDNRTDLMYSFEIDTVHTFTSGFRVESSPISGTAVSAAWRLPFALTENQVYYWRARFTDKYPVSWSTGSFKYKAGKQGWAQSRPPQMFEANTVELRLDTISRMWTFDPRLTQMHAYIQPVSNQANYFFGSNTSAGEPPAGCMYTTFDQFTLNSSVKGTLYGDWRYAAPPSATDPNTILDIVTTIHEMRQGDYFLMVTNVDPKFSFWQDNYVAAFADIGVDPQAIAQLENGDRAVVFGKKGGVPGSGIALTQPNVVVAGANPRIDLLMNVSTTVASGEATSTLIGPAKAWQSANFEWHSVQTAENDSLLLDVQGLDAVDNLYTFATNLNEGLHPIQNIDAQTIPILRLKGSFADHVKFSSPQLDVWEVYFSPVADLAVDPAIAFKAPDTIAEGQIVDLQLGIRNLTQFSSDSVAVRYSLLRQDRSSLVLGNMTLDSLAAYGQTSSTFRFHSAGKGLEQGLVYLVFEINPDQTQPEQHFFNNQITIPIYVIKDKVGPILNVTVDGKILMEGDFVQPNPEIVIQVNDENPYLPVAISDSTYYIWFGPERSYQFNPQLHIATDARLAGTPGRLPDNKAKLTFTPGKLPDGEYTLAVQSKDFSGNESGKDAYVIHFNVESDKAVSEVLPYPNPFSTSTRFVYTLTGDEKPYVFELQIFTISGRLVKVIDLLEMGEVHFGKNITEYAWDGRDEFGDLLANGVYVYKTNVKFKDRYGVKDMETGLEGYFKNGFGKVYIMR